MRIVSRKIFLTLPAGTAYCKGKPWVFEGLSFKGNSYSNDWSYLHPEWVDANDCGEAFGRLEDMLNAGASHPMATAYGRDGCFDDEDVFMIFEASDLDKLAELIGEARKNFN